MFPTLTFFKILQKTSAKTMSQLGLGDCQRNKDSSVVEGVKNKLDAEESIQENGHLPKTELSLL